MEFKTSTALGKLCDPPLTAQLVNQKLEAAGYHVKDAEGVWRATDLGKPVSVFVKMGPVGGFNKWSPDVAAMLGAKAPAAAAPAKKKSKLGVFGKKVKAKG